jgi:hypothetical protein
MAFQTDRIRRPAPLLASITCLAGLVALAPLAASADPIPPKSAATKTIGLALTSWRNALYETTPDAKEECTLGVQPGEVAQFKAMKDGVERLKQYGGTFENRGPNGETGNFSPLSVEDPLPFSEVRTKVGYGLNLDGTKDGHATAKTCAHEKFTSPEGQSVDNQLARVIGCVQGYRMGGMMSDYYSQEIADFAVNRHLIEITGVEDEMNSPHVEITIYKGFDRLVRTGDNKFVPFLSQRIDERYPQYTMHTHGKIVDGVLITDPIPNAVMPHSSERNIGDREMHDMRLRLKLTDDGAEGILAGYDKWANWYNWHAKGVVSEVGKYTSPSIYRAFMRYADGSPDPKTGQCSYISATYNVTAVRAIIVHPNKKQDPGRAHVASAQEEGR